MTMMNFLMRIDRRAVLMDQMIAKLGLSQAIKKLADRPNVLRRATLRCHTCSQGAACAAWMANCRNPTEAPAYCKNHDLFERLMDRAAA